MPYLRPRTAGTIRFPLYPNTFSLSGVSCSTVSKASRLTTQAGSLCWGPFRALRSVGTVPRVETLSFIHNL